MLFQLCLHQVCQKYRQLRHLPATAGLTHFVCVCVCVKMLRPAYAPISLPSHILLFPEAGSCGVPLHPFAFKMQMFRNQCARNTPYKFFTKLQAIAKKKNKEPSRTVDYILSVNILWKLVEMSDVFEIGLNFLQSLKMPTRRN